MNNNNNGIKKLHPTVYRVYDYLKANHYGANKGIVKPLLAKRLGLSTRALRRITREINATEGSEKLVSTEGCCYMCETERECEHAIRSTYKRAFDLLKKARTMERKVERNGQGKLQLGKYYKEFVSVFEEE